MKKDAIRTAVNYLENFDTYSEYKKNLYILINAYYELRRKIAELNDDLVDIVDEIEVSYKWGGTKNMRMALTGHRPARLGYDNNLNHPDWYPIIDWIKGNIQEYGIIDIYSGMAEGCDMACALAAIQVKSYGYPLKLHCVLPCKDYQSSHPLYDYIKNRADEWIELSEEYYKGCDNVRDQYMVDHSDILLSVWDGNKSGGVWSTIRKAQKKGINIIYYPKEKL